MYRFHCTLFAAPELPAPESDAKTNEAILEGQTYRALAIPSNQLTHPLGATFEQVEYDLVRFPQLLCEPDGSFVWSGSVEGSRWQVDGLMFDRAGAMHSIELKGECPTQEFDRLLGTVGWPKTPVVFQLAWEGVVLDEEQFRLWASRD